MSGTFYTHILDASVGGAWGTALAMHAAAMGHDTLIWAREPEVVKSVNDPAVKENVTYLKVCHFASSLQCPHLSASKTMRCCQSYPRKQERW